MRDPKVRIEVVVGHRLFPICVGCQRRCSLVEVVLEGELGCVHADDDQAMIFVFGGPCADIRKRAAQIDTGVGPEIDEYNLPAQAGFNG